MMERRFRSFGFLLTEFFVIVLGVLVALAVDEWREQRSEARLERYFLESLAADLKSDSADFFGFTRGQAIRTTAADVILKAARHSAADTISANRGSEEGLSVGMAFARIGWSNHLEPTRSSFTAMINSGGIAVVSDPDLRRSIVDYYTEIDDKVDINNYIELDLQVYRRKLESFGYSVSDGKVTDPTKMLADSELLALVRSLRSRARLGHRYGDELWPLASELRKQINDRLR